MRERVLITGGAGFIGSHVADRLLADGFDVTVFDTLDPQVHGRRVRPAYLARDARLLRGDIRNREAVRKALARIDVVIHLAAAVGVGQSQYEIRRYVEVNELGTATLLDCLANGKHRVRKLLVAASMSSYGEGAYRCAACGLVRPALRPPAEVGPGRWEPRCPRCAGPLSPAPTAEDQPYHENSTYAITKANQEALVLNFGRTYDLPAVALRFFNVYGPRQSLSNPYTGVAAIFLSRAKNDHPPVVYEDGKQTRDFVSVHDVAEACRLAVVRDAADHRAINIGTGVPLPVAGMAESILKLLGKTFAPTITGAFRKGDVRHCYPDLTRAQTLLGWTPRVSFEEGMRELIAWSDTVTARDGFAKAHREMAKKGLV
ncbi:MAG: GDP-mannose 4,6-dehydratase [Planctomycetes bacterium]|nr:GDP-mannose 4,6-dehydratase [Planctomycetota bacterium]